VDADSRLLRVVLDNLIGNAWKFTSKTVQARIEFDVDLQKGESVYFVRDNGAGFNMTYAAKLFGPFQRLHADTDFPGTGIGLATVRRIVDRHGGRVWPKAPSAAGRRFPSRSLRRVAQERHELRPSVGAARATHLSSSTGNRIANSGNRRPWRDDCGKRMGPQAWCASCV